MSSSTMPQRITWPAGLPMEFSAEFGPALPAGDVSYAFASMDRVDDGSEFVVPHRQPAQFVGIGQNVRVGQLLFDGLVLVDDVAEAFEHGHPRLLAAQRRRPGAGGHTVRMSTGVASSERSSPVSGIASRSRSTTVTVAVPSLTGV